MSTETQHQAPLTKHQQRVLAALLALEQTHKWDWWGRDAIGNVVEAGGFHRTIQRKTMFVLHDRGLVIRQAETWSEEMRNQVRCPCALHKWGLTDAGRETTTELYIRLSPEMVKRIELQKADCINWLEERLRHEEDDDDDEEGDSWKR